MPATTYRELFSLTGPLYVLIAFLARLPLAMSQLGTMLLVQSVTGSIGYGGISAGAVAVSNAVVAPAFGALADRRGQRPVLLVQSIGSGVALVTLVLLAQSGASWGSLALVAAIAGAFLPQVGSLARVRWRALAHRNSERRFGIISTSFSYEGAADEAAFVLGPAVVGVVVALINPTAALLLAAAIMLICGVSFAIHPTANIVPKADAVSSAGRIITGFFVVLVTAQFSLGMVFGSVQAGTISLADAAGEPGLAGLLHAVLGVGSAIAGLAVALLPASFTLRSRLMISGSLLFVLSLPLLLVESLSALAAVLLVLGIACAPFMITNYSLAERTLPSGKLSAALMVLAGAVGIGYATGSSLAGRIADLSDHTGAFMVTIGAGLLATAIGVGVWLHGRRHPQSHSQPHQGPQIPQVTASTDASVTATHRQR